MSKLKDGNFLFCFPFFFSNIIVEKKDAVQIKQSNSRDNDDCMRVCSNGLG